MRSTGRARPRRSTCCGCCTTRCCGCRRTGWTIRAGTGSCCPRGTVRPRTTRCWRPRGSSRSGRGRQPVLVVRLGCGRHRGALRGERLVGGAGAGAGSCRASGGAAFWFWAWPAPGGGFGGGKVMSDMRTVFAATASSLLDEDPLTAVVLAEISADLFAKAAARHPERVLNVGIREQLMVSVGGGLALAGLRPIVHTYAPFLVERAFEQVKLDLAHQGARAVLVSIGASYDAASSGRTHQAPEDVALVDTVPGFSVVVPGHPDEVPELLRSAVGALDSRSTYVRLSSKANRSALPVWPGL